MDQQPKIPTLKDMQKPQVKLRGFQLGATLFDRLKQFKKKELAFILAGLGTLFMAPLAEHFLMSPETGEGTLQQGWRGSGAGGVFTGDGHSPFETGEGMNAPGGPTGGSDIITPLNVRDPSNLVMGPGATQQPPTNSVAPQTPPPGAPKSSSDSDLKDALAASARGMGAAAKKAPMPIPKMALGGSGLRGLGAASGGSSASASLGPISSNGLAPNRAAESNSMRRVNALPDYKGVATRGPGTGGGGALENLKKAADAAGSTMNRGSAAGALDTAASQSIPGGGAGTGGFGQGGTAANDKSPGGNQDKSGKNVGESLAFQLAKQRAEKEMELEFKKKEAGDWELQSLQWRNEFIKGMMGDMQKGLSSVVGGWIKDTLEKAKDSPVAWNNCEGVSGKILAAEVSTQGCNDGKEYVWKGVKGGMYRCNSKGITGKGEPEGWTETPIPGCVADMGKGGSKDPTPGATNVGDIDGRTPTGKGMTNEAASNLKSLGRACEELKGASSAFGDVTDAEKYEKKTMENTLAQAAKIVAMRDALYGTPTTDCDAKSIFPSQDDPKWKDKSAFDLQKTAVQPLVDDSGALARLVKGLGDSEVKDNTPFKDIADSASAVKAARQVVDAVEKQEGSVDVAAIKDPNYAIIAQRKVVKDDKLVERLTGHVKAIKEAKGQVSAELKNRKDAQEILEKELGTKMIGSDGRAIQSLGKDGNVGGTYKEVIDTNKSFNDGVETKLPVQVFVGEDQNMRIESPKIENPTPASKGDGAMPEKVGDIKKNAESKIKTAAKDVGEMAAFAKSAEVRTSKEVKTAQDDVNVAAGLVKDLRTTQGDVLNSIRGNLEMLKLTGISKPQ